MRSQQLEAFAKALSCLTDALGIASNELAEAEKSHIVRLEKDVPAALLRGLASNLVEPLREFVAGVRFEVSYEEFRLFELTSDGTWYLSSPVEQVETCKVLLHVKKVELARMFGETDSRIFLSEAALHACLRKALLRPGELEATLFRDQGTNPVDWKDSDLLTHSTVVVAASRILLTGPLLTIVGSAYPVTTAFTASPDTIQRAASSWALAKQYLRWDNIQPVKGLTTHHLKIEVVKNDTGDLAGALGLHRAHLALLFLSERAERLPTTADLRLVLVADRSRVDIVLSTQRQVAATAESVEELAALCEEAFGQPFEGDRLKLARTGLVEAVRFEEPEDAFERLLARANDVRADVDWHWSRFINDKVDAYLKEERELEDRLGKTIEAFETRTSEVIKAASDTALAAIAAVLGSMVASLFGGKFNELVFRTGLIGYAVYAVTMPGAYGLTSIVLRYRAALKSYGIEEGRIAKIIRPQRVDDIVRKRVSASGRRFWGFFYIACGVIVSLCVLCLLAARFLPALFLNQEILNISQTTPRTGP